jgi:ribosome maturation factor RimP
MAQRGRGAAAGARPTARTGARPTTGRDAHRADAPRAEARRPGFDLAAIRTRLRTIIEPAVMSAGLDLEDLVVAPAGRRLVVRITVDGDDGVSHDELSAVSRELSARLDAAEETGGELTPDSYTLEVSSPGVDRPLTLPRHWRRNVGRLVKVKAGDRSLTARIASVDDLGVTMDADGREVSVAFGELGPGRVQIEFTRVAELADEDFGELAGGTTWDSGNEFDHEDDDDQDDDDQDDDDEDDDQEGDGGEDADGIDGGIDEDVDDLDRPQQLDGPQQKEDGA